ncbi:MAG: hypothetical protein QXJ17_01490 [Nitrososphaeria archaeon]
MSKPEEKLVQVKTVTKEYSELHQVLKTSSTSLKSTTVKSNINNVRRSKNFGNNLSKLGVALILFPDPTISDLLGSIMVLSGQYLQRRSPIGIKEAQKEFRKISEEIGNVHMF